MELKQMNLNLVEKFVMLAIDEKSGRWMGSENSNFLSYGIAGAILWELYFNQRIRIENNSIFSNNPNYLGDPILDGVLAMIQCNRKIQSIEYWLREIPHQMQYSYDFLIHNLVEKGLIQICQRPILWFFSQHYAQFLHPIIKNEILSELEFPILAEEPQISPSQALLNLALLFHLVNAYFPREFERLGKRRLKILEQYDPIRDAIQNLIDEENAAASAAVIAAIV
jgi:hypothetical protein